MALSTYSDLLTSIADWSHRADLASKIPDFVALCESDLNKRVRVSQMETSTTLTASTEFTTLPTDFLEARKFQLNVNPVEELSYMSPQQMEFYFGSSPGKPKYHAIIGNTLQLAPVPDTTYTIGLTYYAKIPALSNTNQTNWLLTSNPEIYLNGSLLWTAPFIQNDARIVIWKKLYDTAVDELNLSDQVKIHSGSVLQMRVQ